MSMEKPIPVIGVPTQPKPAIAIPTQPKPAIKAPAKPNPSISAPAKPKPVNAIPKQPNNLAKQVAAAVPLAANRAFLVKKAEDKLTEGQKGWYKMMQRELEQSEQYQQMSNKARRKKMFKSKFAWLCNQNFITKEQTMMTLETLKQYHKDVEENKAQTKSAKKIARAKLVKRAAYAGVTPKEQKDIERNASKQKKLENKIELINARIRLIDGPLNRKEPTQKSFQKCFQFPAVLDLTRGYSTMETKEPSVVTGGYQYLNDGWMHQSNQANQSNLLHQSSYTDFLASRDANYLPPQPQQDFSSAQPQYFSQQMSSSSSSQYQPEMMTPSYQTTPFPSFPTSSSSSLMPSFEPPSNNGLLPIQSPFQTFENPSQYAPSPVERSPPTPEPPKPAQPSLYAQQFFSKSQPEPEPDTGMRRRLAEIERELQEIERQKQEAAMKEQLRYKEMELWQREQWMMQKEREMQEWEFYASQRERSRSRSRSRERDYRRRDSSHRHDSSHRSSGRRGNGDKEISIAQQASARRKEQPRGSKQKRSGAVESGQEESWSPNQAAYKIQPASSRKA